MGYFINKITKDPDEQTAKVSLSDNPNFVTFSSINESSEEEVVNTPVFSIKITGCGYKYISSQPHGIKEYENIADFTIKETATGIEHRFIGTSDISKLNSNSFYLGYFDKYGPAWLHTRNKTAESLFNCLSENDFLKSKFELSLPPIVYSNENISGGDTIYLRPKRNSKYYAFDVIVSATLGLNNQEEINDKTNSFNINLFNTFTITEGQVTDNDTISEGHDSCEIRLDIYKDCKVFLGMDDKPNTDNLGTYVSTLSKAYIGKPLWFNLNILGGSRPATDFSPKEKNVEWFDSGTMSNFRFVAKRFISDSTKHENQTFFYSDVFYQLTGYSRTLEKNDLSAYIFDTQNNKVLETDSDEKKEEKKIKLLTTQPELTHTTGQHQYLNFVLSDPNRNAEQSFELGILYRFYTSHRKLIDEVVTHQIAPKNLNMVNSVRLNLDQYLATRSAAAGVEVCLCQCEEDSIHAVSHPLSFRVMPECLYKVHDFAFLNRLGGWSSFNFSGTEKTDFKTKATTIYQTHTPYKTIGSEIESVYSKEVTESFSVETMPITREVCDWLRELSTSKAVYELSTGRYVIVDDMNIKHDTKDELFRVEMKYHYTDSYNARIE